MVEQIVNATEKAKVIFRKVTGSILVQAVGNGFDGGVPACSAV